MMQELNLSEEEATEISQKINDAINRISSSAEASGRSSATASTGNRSPGSSASPLSVSPSASVCKEVDQLAAAVAGLSNGGHADQERAGGGGASISGREPLREQQKPQGVEQQSSSPATMSYSAAVLSDAPPPRLLSTSSSFAGRSSSEFNSQSGSAGPITRPTSYHDLVKVMTAHFDANGGGQPTAQHAAVSVEQKGVGAAVLLAPAAQCSSHIDSFPIDDVSPAEEDDVLFPLPLKA